MEIRLIIGWMEQFWTAWGVWPDWNSPLSASFPVLVLVASLGERTLGLAIWIDLDTRLDYPTETTVGLILNEGGEEVHELLAR